MTPHEILAALWSEGIRVGLTKDGKSLSVTAGKLTPTQRAQLLSAKPLLITFLAECLVTSEAVIASAMRRCNQFGDGPFARAEMVKQCREVPAHLQSDLLQALGGSPTKHIHSTAPRFKNDGAYSPRNPPRGQLYCPSACPEK
jgi:hypothetical protein